MASDLKKLIDNIAETCGCDKTRISLTGHSLGAMGVIEVLVKYPNDFAAGASLSCAKNYTSELHKAAFVMPSDDEIRESIEIARREECIVRIDYFVPYSGQYHLDIDPESTFDGCYACVHRSYPV